MAQDSPAFKRRWGPLAGRFGPNPPKLRCQAEAEKKVPEKPEDFNRLNPKLCAWWLVFCVFLYIGSIPPTHDAILANEGLGWDQGS